MTKKILGRIATYFLTGLGVVLVIAARLPIDQFLLRASLDALHVDETPKHRLGVNKENFDRIQVGMTRADIAAIFGRHADKSYFGPYMWSRPNGTCAMFHFDDNARVIQKFWVERP